MNERIKQLRKVLGLSQEDFARKLGLKSRGKIANIEFGKIEVDSQFAALICKQFNVNRDWLENGHGDMFTLEMEEELDYISFLLSDSDNPLNTLIKSILKTYLEADENQKAVIKSFAKDLTKNTQKENRD